MNDNLVSIISPTYNCADYIVDSIYSVINQTYTQWELIIIDDCSTDATEEIVRSFHDNRIKYIKLEKQSGAAHARNVGIRMANGRYIAFLDSDDMWSSEKLSRQIMYMKDKGCSFSYTEYEEIDEYGSSLHRIVSGPKIITRKGMLAYCWPGCLTVMYDSYRTPQLQIPEIKKNNDYAMWLIISKYHDCHLIPEVLSQYRKRVGSISNHSKLSLVKWHYRLFRNLNYNSITSYLLTCGNLICGVWKKVRYVRKK